MAGYVDTRDLWEKVAVVCSEKNRHGNAYWKYGDPFNALNNPNQKKCPRWFVFDENDREFLKTQIDPRAEIWLGHEWLLTKGGEISLEYLALYRSELARLKTR